MQDHPPPLPIVIIKSLTSHRKPMSTGRGFSDLGVGGEGGGGLFGGG